MTNCRSNQQKLCGNKECEICFNRSFATHEKAKYWSDKNGDIKPWMIRNSKDKYWFECDICNHYFDLSTSNIMSLNRWCPYCCKNTKILCKNDNCEMCFNRSFASHPKSKFLSKKNKDDDGNLILPREIACGSQKKYYFDCECGHEIFMILNNITSNDNWCSYCCFPSQKLCDDNNCKLCFNNSFASHKDSHLWDITKNKKKTPRQILKHANKICYFYCKSCNHYFDRNLNNINDNVCSFCHDTKICGDENCNHCFSKSFASHKKSKFFSGKNKLKPFQINMKSEKSFIFNCENGHEFQAILGNVASKTKPTWCPECKKKKLSDMKRFTTDEFIEKANTVHQNKYIYTETIYIKSDIFVKIICKEHGVFDQIPNSHLQGCGCPKCVNKGEAKLFEHLDDIYEDVVHQYKVNWCKNNKNNYLPFDIAIPSAKLIFEIDGGQHFEQVSNWNSPEETQKNDVYKMKKALENGFTVIRILQEDVYYDKINWKEELKKVIKKYKKPRVIYICCGDEYDKHKKLMNNN